MPGVHVPRQRGKRRVHAISVREVLMPQPDRQACPAARVVLPGYRQPMITASGAGAFDAWGSQLIAAGAAVAAVLIAQWFIERGRRRDARVQAADALSIEISTSGMRPSIRRTADEASSIYDQCGTS